MVLKYKESLQNRWILIIRFKLASPLHVGRGQEGIYNRIVFSNVEGGLHPIVPASSIKGVFRDLSTKIAKNLDFRKPLTNKIVNNHVIDSHFPVEKADDDTNRVRVYRETYFQGYDGIDDDEFKLALARELSSGLNTSLDSFLELPVEEIIELYLSMKCPICRLYGAPGLSSKTIFLDAVVKGSYQVGLYTGTAIERKTGIVKAKHLYNVEYVYPKGETWVDIHIYIDNMDEDEELLIKSLIGLIKATGLRLGGLRSRGYGLLKLDIENSYAVKTIFDGGPEENITKLLRGGTRVSLESLLG